MLPDGGFATCTVRVVNGERGTAVCEDQKFTAIDKLRLSSDIADKAIASAVMTEISQRNK